MPTALEASITIPARPRSVGDPRTDRLVAVKTFMEEDFLGEDPAYARYMRVVRWRWFPGVA